MPSISYLLTGRLTKRISSKIGVFKEIYESAGFSEPYEDYLSKLITGYIFTAPLFYTLLTLLHLQVLGYQLAFSLILSFILLIVYTLIYVALTLYYPVYKRHAAALKIEARLPYTVSYLAALSASGMRLSDLIERVVEVENVKEVRREFSSILTDTSILGLDLLTALERRTRRSPSVMLSVFFAGLREIYVTSGDLYSYTSFMAKRMLELKRYILRSVTNSMAFIAEMYITLMVAAPLLIIIMLVIMGMLGGGFLGIPVSLLVVIILGVMIPASAIAILVMLDGVMSRV